MKRFGRYASFLVLFCCCQFACCQNVSQVFSFSNANSSASPSYVTPAQGRDGALYGTTSGLGQTVTTDGSVFKIATKGAKFSALHNFSGADGAFPLAGLTLGIDGNYYGTTTNGGNANAGVLFKVSAGGTYTDLYQFTGGSDGGDPFSSPIQASDGNFYGTTLQGSNNAGTVYRYAPSSGTFTTIFTFNADQSQGVQILDPLIEGADGNLYGTTNLGGTNNCGTIFELSISGQLIQIYSFPCGAGGNAPAGPLIQASDGNFYGTTEGGGATNTRCSGGCGTVFRMSAGVVSILYNFSGAPQDGMYPLAGLVEGTDGNLYGSTAEGGMLRLGTLFQISKSGQYKQLYSFSAKYGKDPVGGLLQHTNGKFYGTTPGGGMYSEGTLYSLNMGLKPFIALVRYTARVGQSVQILGQGLTGSTGVTINGVTANFKVVSNTYMTAVIPAGTTSGPVAVTTPTGTLTGNHNLRIVQ